jgi:hypothetical protein
MEIIPPDKDLGKNGYHYEKDNNISRYKNKMWMLVVNE